MNTTGSIWPKRSSTPSTPKSGEQDDQIAPMEAAASRQAIDLRHVGQHRRHAVALPDAEFVAGAAASRHKRPQFIPRKLPVDLVLALENQRVRRSRFSQQILGIVQPCVGEEGCARHPVAVDERTLATLSDDTRRNPTAASRSRHGLQPTSDAAPNSSQTAAPPALPPHGRRLSRQRTRLPPTRETRSCLNRPWNLLTRNGPPISRRSIANYPLKSPQQSKKRH